MGGGQLGYLANARATQAEVAVEKSVWDSNVRLYNECQAVEQALHLQLTEAIDDAYLDSLRNLDIDMINDNIPDIIDFLQTNYCRVTP